MRRLSRFVPRNGGFGIYCREISLSMLSLVLLATSAVGLCPIYSLMGISTCPRATKT